jgi:hypothetical protein
MELTTLLSQVFGIYFIVIALIMLIRRQYLKTVLASFADEPMLRFMMGILMLLGGIFLVVSHNEWSSLQASLISLIGWLSMVKSVLYLSLSRESLSKWMNWYYLEHGYGWWGIVVALVLGVYLTNAGFGLV